MTATKTPARDKDRRLVDDLIARLEGMEGGGEMFPKPRSSSLDLVGPGERKSVRKDESVAQAA